MKNDLSHFAETSFGSRVSYEDWSEKWMKNTFDFNGQQQPKIEDVYRSRCHYTTNCLKELLHI